MHASCWVHQGTFRCRSTPGVSFVPQGIQCKQLVELSEGPLGCREYTHAWYWSARWVRLAMRSEGHYPAVKPLQFLSSQKSRPRSLRM